MTIPGLNETLPGASPGGVVEAVKTAFVLGLREAFLGSTIQDNTARIGSVDLEYPLKEEKYPGIWVQFNVTSLHRAGIAHETLNRNDSDPDWVNWEPIQEWFFEGRVTLTVLSLTSLERDRIVDTMISNLSFSRLPINVIVSGSRNTNQNRGLWTSLLENPYVHVTINQDEITPNGEDMNVGAPWGDNVLVYTNSISFGVFGSYNIVFRNDGTYTLRAIETRPEPWNLTEFH